MATTSSRDLNLLGRQDVIDWCYFPITDYSLVNTSNLRKLSEANKIEKAWANEILGTNTAQWTTLFCQELVREALIARGDIDVLSLRGVKSSVRDKTYEPDLISNNAVYEVKGRGWTTAGTAGEKVLGTPLKYGEIPTLLNKKLNIVLVGYQEYEARECWAFGNLFEPETQTKQLQDSLAHFKSQNVEYLAFTDFLKELGLTSSRNM